MLRSPCFECEKLDQEKYGCVEGCKPVKAYQKYLKESFDSADTVQDNTLFFCFNVPDSTEKSEVVELLDSYADQVELAALFKNRLEIEESTLDMYVDCSIYDLYSEYGLPARKINVDMGYVSI